MDFFRELKRRNVDKVAVADGVVGWLVDGALDLLEQTSKVPGGPTCGALKLSAEWDTIRHHPRFQKLLASLAPNDAPLPAK